MKKILHVTECLGSGVLYYIKNVCKWQVDYYEITVAYATRPETPKDFEKQFDKKVKFIKVENFTREITPSKDIKAFFELRSIVKKESPDLIHLHSSKAGVIGRWAINCSKYKVLYSPHAYSFLMQDCSNWKRCLYKTIERISDRKRCITVADIEGEFEESKKIARNSVCIHNGIDCQEMDQLIKEAHDRKKDCDNRHKERLVICTVGKVVPQKNPILFNEIAKKFLNIDFVWIGAGPMEEVLDSENITITGWISRIDAISRVMDSDIFLFTSSWESLSIALIEAMYIGKACVVSSADGNRDIVKNDKNGYVCYSFEDYTNAITKLYNNPKVIESMGEKAKQTVLNEYNTKKMEETYRKFFELIGL